MYIKYISQKTKQQLHLHLLCDDLNQPHAPLKAALFVCSSILQPKIMESSYPAQKFKSLRSYILSAFTYIEHPYTLLFFFLAIT